MGSKIWILLVLALPILLFVTDTFIVSPAIYEKEGALHDFFIKYLVSPAEKMGLSMDDIIYFLPKYVWDFYIIIFSTLLIMITDIKFSDFGFSFTGLKKEIIIGVLFFVVDIILVFGVIYVSSYIPNYVKDFSLSNFGAEKSDVSSNGSASVPAESAKPILGFKFLILNSFYE